MTQRPIKFRLIKDGKIVGYERFVGGLDHLNFWEYSLDNINWTNLKIQHDSKDQFTNLPDKNGKEIYEGDIIDWKIGEPPEGIYEVKWWENGWFLENEDKHKEALYKNLGEKPWTLEVIGNIYENPELLK